MLLLCLLAGCVLSSKVPKSFGTQQAKARVSQGTLPKPSHIVVVIEENKSYGQIVGNDQAPFLNKLASKGALLVNAYGITHPSEPNYLALFSGSTHGLHWDSCPHHYSDSNLASELRQAGLSFATYSQSLPKAGSTACRQGRYARKHNPAVNWQGANVKPGQNLPFSDFPKHWANLPTVSFVIPNIDHDMHSASIAKGDKWLKQHLQGYARWAKNHNSLLIITWDEDNDRHHNHIPVIIAGAHVKDMHFQPQINHYSMLRTIETMYGLPLLGKSGDAMPIEAIWQNRQ